MERLDARSRQAIGFRKAGKVAAVIAEQAVLRAGPEESRPVLEHHLDGQVLQALFFAVKFEIVTLPDQNWPADWNQESNEINARAPVHSAGKGP